MEKIEHEKTLENSLRKPFFKLRVRLPTAEAQKEAEQGLRSSSNSAKTVLDFELEELNHGTRKLSNSSKTVLDFKMKRDNNEKVSRRKSQDKEMKSLKNAYGHI